MSLRDWFAGQALPVTLGPASNPLPAAGLLLLGAVGALVAVRRMRGKAPEA